TCGELGDSAALGRRFRRRPTAWKQWAPARRPHPRTPSSRPTACTYWRAPSERVHERSNGAAPDRWRCRAGLDRAACPARARGDATAMGLGTGTRSVTTFLYDRRGPRAAPALELVDWESPATTPATPEHAPSGFAAVGYRVPSLRSLRARLEALGHPVSEVPKG